jgi:hypothetical protein
VRIVTTIAAVSIALVFVTVSAMMNVTFVSSLGKTPFEGQLFAAVSLSSDAFKALLPLLLTQAWRAGRRLHFVVGSAMFVLFTVVSLLSAIGFASVNRQAMSRSTEVDGERLAAVRQAQASLDARIAALPAHRPVSVVTEAQVGVQQDKRWTTSKRCTDATEARSRQFCEAYFRLRTELATAVEASRLREQREALQTAAIEMQKGGATLDADPQATAVATILWTNKTAVQPLLVLLIPVIVEIGSAFGLFIALQSWKQPKMTAPPAPGSERPEPEAAVPTQEPTAPMPAVVSPNDLPTELAAPVEKPINDNRAQRDADIMRAILRRPILQ